MTVNEKMTAIAEAIRSRTGKTDKLNLDDMAASVDEVYEKGKQDAGSTDHEFWEIYQNNGNRKNYNYAFGGEGWTKETFKPKYDMIPDRCDYMFRTMSEFREDMVEHLENLGVTLDFSKSTLFSECFAYCYAKRIGIIDTRNASSLISVFFNSRIVTIDKLILKDDGSQNLNSTFQGCSDLEHLIVEGTIGYTDVNFSWSNKLSRASLDSIFSALSSSTVGGVLKLSKTAVDNAYGGGESSELQAILAEHPSWTVYLGENNGGFIVAGEGIFYYNDAPHSFQIGMTWQQFMDSDYNFGLTTGDRWEKAGEEEAQQFTDIIENGAYYYPFSD